MNAALMRTIADVLGDNLDSYDLDQLVELLESAATAAEFQGDSGRELAAKLRQLASAVQRQI